MKAIKFICLLSIVLIVNTSFKHPFPTKDDYYIVVTKSTYELDVYNSDSSWIATYPVVFGSKDLLDKQYEGDRRTPEGVFHIKAKRPHPKWDRFMELDYPTSDSYRKFYERKANGEIPQNATIGAAIGIHGTWPKDDIVVDQQQNWTWGCVSTKNTFIEEIYYNIPVGTTVYIKP